MCSLNGSVPPEMKGYLHPAMMMMMMMVMVMAMAVGAGIVSKRPGFPARCHLPGSKKHTARALRKLWPTHLIDQKHCAFKWKDK